MSDQNPYGRADDHAEGNPWRPVGSDPLQSDPYYGGAASSYGGAGQPPPGPQYGSSQQPPSSGPYGHQPTAGQHAYGAAGPNFGAGGGYGAGQPYPGGYPAATTYPGGRPPVGDPGTLDLPHYGVSFAGAVKRAYAKIVRFDGRASRSEYWWFALWNALVNLVLMVLFTTLALATTSDGSELGVGAYPIGILWVIFMLGSVLPIISITMRRLHDQNQSGGLAALMFMPYVGGTITAILALMPSNPQGAQYDQFRSGRSHPGSTPGHYPG
ncbi:MAG TPA: DUF805 domain-containing protein [Microlunatus sp.]